MSRYTDWAEVWLVYIIFEPKMAKVSPVPPNNLYEQDDDSSDADPPTISEPRTAETILNADFKYV